MRLAVITSIVISMFVLPISTLCQDSIPEVGISVDFGKSHAIHKNVYGVNNYIATRPYYTNQSGFIAKYEDLGKPCIRFPGGTFSNYYDFKTGFASPYEGMSEADSLRRVAGPNGSIMKYKGETGGEDYRRFCDFVRKTGAEFNLSLSIIQHTAEENREFFEGFKSEGVELKHVEFGNELYFSEYNIPVPSVEKYIELAKANAAVLREVFPNVKVGVLCPSHIYTHESFLDEVDEGVTTRQTHWFEKLQEEDFYDALVVHMYSTVGMNGTTPASEFLSYEEAYKYSISHADGKFDEAVESLRLAYPNKEVWLTEYHHGGFSGDLRSYRLRYSYLGGFFTAQFMMKMFNTPEMTLGSWHSLVQWLGFSSTSTLLPDDYNFSTKVNYHVFKVFKDPVSKAESIAPVGFTGINQYQGVGEYTGINDDLEGSLFYSGNKAWLILFNKLEQSYKVSQDSLLAALTGLDGAVLESCQEFGPSSSLNLHDGLSSETAYSQETVTADTGYYSLDPYHIYTFSFNHLTLQASNPFPEDGQEILMESVNLKWMEGYLSESSDIYLGNSESSVLSADLESKAYMGRLDTNSYSTGPLAMDTSYFWRVDAVGPDTIVKGPVWSFHTVSDTTPVVFYAKLIFIDRSTGTVIYRAVLTYDYETRLTNHSGEIVFEFTDSLAFDFSVEHSDYFTQAGSVVLKGDTSITIPLTSRLGELSFEISGNEGPLEGVEVKLNGISLTTNAEGKTLFPNKLARRMYGYTLEKEGFATLSDSVWLEVDTTLQIQLQIVAVPETGKSIIRIYPNPAGEIIHVYAAEECDGISILSPAGQTMMLSILQPGKNELDISSLPSGMYLICIQTGKKHHRSKLIKL